MFLTSCLVAAGSPGAGATEPPAAYYAAAFAAATGADLKAALHEAIRGHRVLPYTASGEADTWDAVIDLDADPADPSRVVLVYSGTTLPSSGWGVDPGTWNREHLWPRSFGLNDTIAFSDVFNLRPCEAVVNETRSNLSYDVTGTPRLTLAGAPGSSYDLNSWEPRDADKGAVARAIFYMSTRYQGGDEPLLVAAEVSGSSPWRFGRLSTLLAWHRAFPPDDRERARNHRVYTTWQFNRNPYVDRPSFADRVFSGLDAVEAWRRLRFPTSQLAQPEVSGDLADPDRDGIPNLLEHAVGADPWTATVPVVGIALVTQGGTSTLRVTHARDREAARLTWTYEITTSAATGWTAVVPSTVVTSPRDWQTDTVTATIPVSGASRLVRLKVAR